MRESGNFAIMITYFNKFTIKTIFLILAGCQSLMSLGQDPYYQYQDPEYVLLVAASQGDTNLIRRLITAGVEPDTKSDIGATPIYYAVTNQFHHAVLVLLELGVDPDIPTFRGETPLHAAIKIQNLQIAELLIRNGADMNIEDVNGATPLHYAALYGYYYETDMLLYYEADIETRAIDGTTPLMAAVMSGSFDIADILLKAGANVNSTDQGGFSPILLAAQNGDTIMTELLLLYGADLYSITKDGYNAAAIAIREGRPDYFEYLFSKGNLWSGPEAVNLWRVTEFYRRNEMVPLLQKYQVQREKTAVLNNVSAGISFLTTNHQSFAGVSLGTRKDIKGLGVITGLDFKPFDNRILIMDDDGSGIDQLTQYVDRRNVAYAGIFKEVVVLETNPKARLLLTLTGKAAYVFGNKYPGTVLRPDHKLTFVPAVSLSYEIMGYDISIAAEYMRTEVYKSGPIWIRAGFKYNYYIGNVKTKGKSIKWY